MKVFARSALTDGDPPGREGERGMG